MNNFDGVFTHNLP
jgi:hypothetical protein